MTPLLQHRAPRGTLGVLVVLWGVCSSCSRTQTVPPVSSAPQRRIPTPLPADVGRQMPVTPVDWTHHPWVPDTKPRDWKYIVIHHTATQAGSVESIHRAHLMRTDADGNPWRGIGYHFVIGNGHGMPDGQIEPTFRWRDQLAGAHAGIATYNDQGIGICLIGNFEQTPPSDAQMQSLATLTQSLCADYDIPPQNVKRHGEVKSTACPGRYFSMQELTQILSGEATSLEPAPAATP